MPYWGYPIDLTHIGYPLVNVNKKLWKITMFNGKIHYPPTPADARGSAPGKKTFEDIWPSTTTTTTATTTTTTTTTTTITTTTTMQAAAGSSRQQAAPEL